MTDINSKIPSSKYISAPNITIIKTKEFSQYLAPGHIILFS